MEDSEKSPVLDRLVQFMNSTGLSSSQFADTTGIPRPSLSQMLHGRNKSVNNQVLAKLNAAFPNLNILWLLFGTGNMLENGNIETSEAQNSENNIPKTEQQALNEVLKNQKPTYRPICFQSKIEQNRTLCLKIWLRHRFQTILIAHESPIPLREQDSPLCLRCLKS